MLKLLNMSLGNFVNSTYSKIFKIGKIFVVAITLYILIFGFFQFSTGSSLNSKTMNCPFSNHSMSICKMNPIEHIQEWQSMFTSLPAKDAISIFFVYLLLAIVGTLMWQGSFRHIEIKSFYSRFFSRYCFHIEDPIKKAFSKGLLNPKLF